MQLPRAERVDEMRSAGLSHAQDSRPVDGSGGERGEKSTKGRIVIALVIVGGLVMRLVGLETFPAITADEGLWTWSTKNHVLFGDWFLDRHTHLFLSPLFHWLSIPLFRVFGASIVAGRMVSALAGGISIWLLYVLVRRLTHRPTLAITAALILACSAWAIVQSRQALIESLQVCVILASAVVLTFEGTFAVAGGALLFGLLLLTKINGLFMLAPLALLVMHRSSTKGNPFKSARAWWSALAFALVALVVAASVYVMLFRAHPQDFLAAFKFELDGLHFEGISHPIIRLGRFGIDPIQEGRSVIGLFRLEPILLTFAALGLAFVRMLRPAGASFFVVSLLVGVPYFLAQMFQPIRYFYLLVPAFAFFAALFLDWLGRPGVQKSEQSWQARRAALAVFLIFDLAYAGMNALTSRNTRFSDVRAWVRANARPTDRFLVSAVFATDLPNEALAYYRLVHKPEEIDPVVHQLHIDYVILDDDEWPSSYKEEVARRYPMRFAGAHGAVYEVESRRER